MIDAEHIAKVLNDLMKTDPRALHSVLFNNAPANEAAVAHPTMLCGGVPALGPNVYFFSGIGLVNTLLMGTGTEVRACFTDNRLTHFEAHKSDPNFSVGIQTSKSEAKPESEHPTVQCPHCESLCQTITDHESWCPTLKDKK